MRRALLTALLLCLLAPAVARATPGSAPVPFPMTYGVNDALIDGDHVYLGGSLTSGST